MIIIRLLETVFLNSDCRFKKWKLICNGALFINPAWRLHEPDPAVVSNLHTALITRKEDLRTLGGELSS